jgi:hypothetical protein
MHKFIAKFSEQIEGALCRFDRLVLRGTLRAIAYELGMKTFGDRRPSVASCGCCEPTVCSKNWRTHSAIRSPKKVRLILTALLAARHATLEQLTAQAAA